MFAWFDSKRQRVKREEEEKPIWGVGVAVIPLYQNVTNRLPRLLSRRNIRTTSYLLTKLRQQLRSVKDSLSLKAPGVYRVPCECSASHVEQTGWLVSLRVTEHKQYMCLGQMEKPAIAHHYWAQGHQARFANTKVLYQSDNWHRRMTRESLEIVLMKHSLNQEDGICF